MSSMNCCPYPVEPRGLIITTTYPSDANMFGFHRNDQSSPHAPCGPPWIRNFTGYFFAASKFGGFTMNPCTFFFSAPVNQNGSAGCMEICESTSEFMFVSCLGAAQSLSESTTTH